MPTASPNELLTARLRLVPSVDEHLDGLNALNSDPEVMRYISNGKPETRDETRAIIDRIKARWAREGYSWWTIFELATGEVIGAGCIQNLRRDGKEPDLKCPIEIGWRVRRDRWRQGFAIESARAMAAFAFDRLHAKVLYAVCHPENKGSKAVMEKLGMSYQGLDEWYAMKLTTYRIDAATWRTSVKSAS